MIRLLYVEWEHESSRPIQQWILMVDTICLHNMFFIDLQGGCVSRLDREPCRRKIIVDETIPWTRAATSIHRMGAIKLLELQKNLGSQIVFQTLGARIEQELNRRINQLGSLLRNIGTTRLLSAMRLVSNTFCLERVTTVAMFTLWALSVLLLQHGAEGTQVVLTDVQGKLPSCNFPGAMPGLDCFDPPKLADIPLCYFKHQRAGIDCRPKSSPAVKVWTPVTKIWWITCFKCIEVAIHCGICFIEFAGLLIAQNPAPGPAENLTADAAVSTLNFYNFDTSLPPNFYDVAILAEHKIPITTKTIRVWKSGSGYPNNANPVGNMSSLAFCDFQNCLYSVHSCWKCLGNMSISKTLTDEPVSAFYNFDKNLAPFYDVAILPETPIKTKTVRGVLPDDVATWPVGNLGANFSLGEDYLEISFANGTKSDSLTSDQSKDSERSSWQRNATTVPGRQGRYEGLGLLSITTLLRHHHIDELDEFGALSAQGMSARCEILSPLPSQ